MRGNKVGLADLKRLKKDLQEVMEVNLEGPKAGEVLVEIVLQRLARVGAVEEQLGFQCPRLAAHELQQRDLQAGKEDWGNGDQAPGKIRPRSRSSA